MKKIIGISGSLRVGSFNTFILSQFAKNAPPGVSIEQENIRGIPLYDFDVEQRGTPEEVIALKEKIIAADGLLIVTPEYNNSMPGVLKNAVDWLSRPSTGLPRVLAGKPVALCGATPGKGGTRLSQTAWLPVFRTLGARVYFGKQLNIDLVNQKIDLEVQSLESDLQKSLKGFLQGFVTFL